MNYKPVFFLFLVVFASLFQACPLTPEPAPRPFVPLPPEIKAYTFFEEGSYWIYQNDSLPSYLDSAYVRRPECGDNYGVDKTDFDYERCSYELVYLTQPWLQIVLPFYSENPEGPYLYVLREYSVNYQKKSYHFFSDVVVPDTMRAGDGATFITGRYDTLEVNGIKYLDVVRITHTAATFQNPVREIHYARGVGIIKRLQWDGSSWSLLRHHVIQ